MDKATARPNDPFQLERDLQSIYDQYLPQFRAEIIDHLSPVLLAYKHELDSAEVEDRLDATAAGVARLASEMAGRVAAESVKSSLAHRRSRE